MSFLSAFLRGAAGPGLASVVARGDRMDEERRAADRRKAEIEDERRWREQEAEKARKHQVAMQEDRQDFTGSRGSAGGTRSGGAGALPGGGDDLIAASVMASEKVDEATARGYLGASRAGRNPLTTEEEVPQQIDDGGRMRTVTTRQTVPDAKRWAEINSRIGQAVLDAATIQRSNFDQYTQGQGRRQAQEMVGASVKAGQMNEGQGALVLGGHPAVTPAGANAITGVASKGSVAEAQRSDEFASAGRHRAAGNKDDAEARDRDVIAAQEAVSRTVQRVAGAALTALAKDPMLTPDEKATERARILAEAEKDPRVVAAQKVADDTAARSAARRSPAAAPAAGSYPDAPRDPAQRRVNATYKTPKGLMVWRGNGWEPVRGPAQR